MAAGSSRERILRELRAAARKGDRTALAVALDGMRTLALSPRYWEKYLLLLRNPLARLVDLLVIKQGERIAHLKGRKLPPGGLRPPSDTASRQASRGRRPASKRRSPPRGPARAPRRRPAPAAEQQTLFEL